MREANDREREYVLNLSSRLSAGSAEIIIDESAQGDETVDDDCDGGVWVSCALFIPDSD